MRKWEKGMILWHYMNIPFLQQTGFQQVFFVEVPKNVFEGEVLASMVIKVWYSLLPSKCYQTTFTGIECSWLDYVKDF